MKEKENEITDLADCTNHAYHVLWLARRIQHLWIIAAIIVRECTGRGLEVEGGDCRLAGRRLPLWSMRASVRAPGLVGRRLRVFLGATFAETEGRCDESKLRERLSFTFFFKHILGEPPWLRLHFPL